MTETDLSLGLGYEVVEWHAIQYIGKYAYHFRQSGPQTKRAKQMNIFVYLLT